MASKILSDITICENVLLRGDRSSYFFPFLDKNSVCLPLFYYFIYIDFRRKMR
jgi:hypothetical protein